MAAVGLEILGVVGGGALASLPLFEKLLAPAEDLTTTVRVVLGSNATLSASLSGDLPSVALWDDFGQSIGTTFSNGKVVPQGNFRDIHVVANASVGNIQPAYLSVVNGGNDAICISAITVTAPDSTKISWSADVAVKCGEAAFFVSNNLVSEGYAPKCIFIDGNGSNGIKHQGFGLHLPDFFSHQAQKDAYNKNIDTLCNSGPRFRMYEKLRPEDPILIYDPILEKNPDQTDKDLSRIIGAPGKFANQDEGALRKVCEGHSRAEVPCSRCSGIPPPFSIVRGGTLGPGCGTKIKNTRRNPKFGRRMPWLTNSSTPQNNPTLDIPAGTPQQPTWKWQGRVIISNMAAHSAEELCNSKNSWGPDIVAVREGKFCSMRDKILYDVCSDQITSCCFDVPKRQMRSCSGQLLGAGIGGSNATNVYDDVHEWN